MKKIFISFLCLTITLGLIACSQNHYELTQTNVYLANHIDDTDLFVDSVNILKTNNSNSNNANPPKSEKELIIKSKKYDLMYSHSDRLRDIYSTPDNGITGKFDCLTGKILQLTIAKHSGIAIPSNLSESQYIDWIKQIVCEYYAEDWSLYTYSCETTIQIFGNDYVENTKRKGFHSATNETEVVSSYTFSFRMYISDFATSDEIKVYHELSSDSITIDFSKHEFDQTEQFSVNMEEVRNDIDTFLKQSINANIYRLVNYEITNPAMTFINGKIFYQCTISLCLAPAASDNNNYNVTQLIPIVVQI